MDLTYLIEFLDANTHEIAEAMLYDHAAVAGDVAALGRILRENNALRSTERDDLKAVNS